MQRVEACSSRRARKALAGITVIIEGTEDQAFSDGEGRFVLETTKTGKVALLVPGFDYLDARLVEIPTEPVTIRLEPKSTARYRTVARGKTGDAARILIPVEQARGRGHLWRPLKGTRGPPRRGAPSSRTRCGCACHRGSAPEDTKFYIDGMPLFRSTTSATFTRSSKTSGSRHRLPTRRLLGRVRQRHRRLPRRDPGDIKTTASMAIWTSTSSTPRRSSPHRSASTGASARPSDAAISTPFCPR